LFLTSNIWCPSTDTVLWSCCVHPEKNHNSPRQESFGNVGGRECELVLLPLVTIVEIFHWTDIYSQVWKAFCFPISQVSVSIRITGESQTVVVCRMGVERGYWYQLRETEMTLFLFHWQSFSLRGVQWLLICKVFFMKMMSCELTCSQLWQGSVTSWETALSNVGTTNCTRMFTLKIMHHGMMFWTDCVYDGGPISLYHMWHHCCVSLYKCTLWFHSMMKSPNYTFLRTCLHH
jgi:hypothetical protein